MLSAFKTFTLESQNTAGITTNVIKLKQSNETESIYKNGLQYLIIYLNLAKKLFIIALEKSLYPEILVTFSDVKRTIIIIRTCKGEHEYHNDMSKPAQGTYFVKIKTDKELVVSKLVIIK